MGNTRLLLSPRGSRGPAPLPALHPTVQVCRNTSPGQPRRTSVRCCNAALDENHYLFVKLYLLFDWFLCVAGGGVPGAGLPFPPAPRHRAPPPPRQRLPAAPHLRSYLHSALATNTSERKELLPGDWPPAPPPRCRCVAPRPGPAAPGWARLATRPIWRAAAAATEPSPAPFSSPAPHLVGRCLLCHQKLTRLWLVLVPSQS